MATYSVTGSKLYFGGYDLSGTATQLSAAITAEELDSTTFGDGGWRSRKAGLKQVALSGQGFNESDGTGDPDDLFNDNLGTTSLLTVAETDGADGEPATSFQGLPFSFTPEGNVGQLWAYQFDITGKTAVAHGTILHPGATARTATGTGTGRQLGSVSSSQKLYAALHVIEASGTSPTLDVVVQSDDNSGFSSATSRVTFAQASDVTSEWATPVDGAISDDYFRVSYTIGGTSPSFKFVVVVAIGA